MYSYLSENWSVTVTPEPPENNVFVNINSDLTFHTGVYLMAMFGIRALMLTWGFEAEAERLRARTMKRLLAKRQGVEHRSDTSDSSSNGATDSNFGGISTSDEEYLEIIGDYNDAQSGKNASSLDKVQSLVSQVETLEHNISITNVMLNLILNEKRSASLDFH